MRTIDGDELKKGIEQQFCTACDSRNGVRCSACDVADCLMYIDDAPTIEAEPVKHGRWIDGWICSECNYGSHEPNMPYCARCGARMDGDET